MQSKTGVAEYDQVAAILPSPERRAKGPYAVIECFQKIPCNPCSVSCPFNAILPMEDINDLPELVADRCTGCGICAGVCPGLAIFIVDESQADGRARVTIPYEFLPLPQPGDRVMGLDRAGEAVVEVKVTRVFPGRKNGTAQVTLSVPPDQVHHIRFFKSLDDQDAGQLVMTSEQDTEDSLATSDNTIICRCEGITVGDVQKLIRQGYTTVDEIKRISRAGMGPCQARTCGPLIAAEIARMTGIPVEEVEPSAHRPPTKSLPIAFFMEES